MSTPTGSGQQLDLFDLRTGRKADSISLETSGEWKNVCGIALVPRGNDAHSMLVSTSVVAQPAEGIHPAYGTLTFRAHDAMTGSLIWKKDVDKDSEEWASSCEGATAKELNLSATSDGAYALVSPGLESYVVSLADGSLRKVPDSTIILDRWLGVPQEDSEHINPVSVDIEAPDSGKKLGTVSDQVTEAGFEFGSIATYRDLLVVLNGQDAQGESAVKGYSLPSGKPAWSLRHSDFANSGYLVTMDMDAATATAIVYDNGGGSIGALAAVDIMSGKIRWEIDGSDDFCGTAGGRVYLRVNSQLAVLDTKTKKQLRFDSSDTECPHVFPGALMYTGETSEDITNTYQYRIAAP
ncbi:hypothetical protein [Streptomyces sp. NPDC088261]|uniref:hypothetical protein n=1 Tax=Streptomyces sp. NPDC088261 TaxID=3365851 RepID=UPI00380E3835